MKKIKLTKAQKKKLFSILVVLVVVLSLIHI